MGINGLSFQICVFLQKYTVGKRLQKFWPPCKSHTEDSLGKKKRYKILCWPSKWRWVLSYICTNESKAKWCPNSVAEANQCYVSQSLLDFYEGGNLFSLCLFLLLGKQARIKMEGVALKSSVFVAPWLHPMCVVLKRASVSHREEEYSAFYKWLWTSCTSHNHPAEPLDLGTLAGTSSSKTVWGAA